MPSQDSGDGATLKDKPELTSLPMENIMSGDDLRKLGFEYAALLRQLKSLKEEEHRLWPGEAWTEEVEAQRARTTDPMKKRMAEIRWTAARLRATDLHGLQAKASILQDIIDDEPGNICAQLTHSLCRDLLSLHQNLISFHGVASREDGWASLAKKPLTQIETAPTG